MYSVCGVHYHDIGTDRLPEGYRHKNPKRVIAMSSFMTTYRYDQSYEKAVELENNACKKFKADIDSASEQKDTDSTVKVSESQAFYHDFIGEER
ncbi:hypothetical protein LTS18_003230 [Coniosporium uncinatum]|uniref:Uncharacterized protein n=1 Tax=Coniosporium uncinatum TaxID=93489 RepID=A0ACC3DTT6_9PEZI|nr:hypothetical protein LTS18_003230 [Coniosporium uncinatum]